MCIYEKNRGELVWEGFCEWLNQNGCKYNKLPYSKIEIDKRDERRNKRKILIRLNNNEKYE